MTDLETWFLDFGSDHIFRMLEVRKPGQFTPYEMDRKYLDQSFYIDDHYTYIQIKDLIELPDKDVLLEYREVYDLKSIEENWDKSFLYYVKLSGIELSYCPEDNNIEKWE